MTSGVPFAGELLLFDATTNPAAQTINLPRNFVLTRIEVSQPAGTTSGFTADVYLPSRAALTGYVNNSQTLDATKAGVAAKLTTITVASSATKGAYDCTIPTQARDLTGGIDAINPATLEVAFTVTSPASGKMVGVRVFGVTVVD